MNNLLKIIEISKDLKEVIHNQIIICFSSNNRIHSLC